MDAGYGGGDSPNIPAWGHGRGFLVVADFETGEAGDA
jgi:hypothetical protein